MLLWLSVLSGNHNTKLDQEVSVMYIAIDDLGKIALIQIKIKATKTNPFDMVLCSMWAGLAMSYVWYTDYI